MITIGTFTIDAALKEVHDLDSEATQFPADDGADITDHTRKMPDRVQIEGIVSDTPLGRAAVARAGVQALIDDGLIERTRPSADAREALEKIRDDGKPITITTSLRVYPNMFMDKLSFPRDAATGGALRFSASFHLVRVVKNQRKRVAVPRGSGARKAGTRPAKQLQGLAIMRCVKDRDVYVKASDVELARTTQGNNLSVFNDWRLIPAGEYTTPMRLCIEKERINFDKKANGGNGAYLHKDGTPLTPDERIDLATQLDRDSDIDGSDPYNVPIDKRSGLPVVKSDRKWKR